MKVLKAEIPDKLEVEIKEYVKSGWFKDESELVRYSLQEFIHKNKPELAEIFNALRPLPLTSLGYNVHSLNNIPLL